MAIVVAPGRDHLPGVAQVGGDRGWRRPYMHAAAMQGEGARVHAINGAGFSFGRNGIRRRRSNHHHSFSSRMINAAKGLHFKIKVAVV